MKHILAIILTFVLFVGSVAAQSSGFREPESGKWYRLVTRYHGGDGVRPGRCIQYFPPGSAHPGMLWSAPQVSSSSPDYPCQCWQFRRSPDNSALFALVCMADSSGFLNPEPTAHDQTGRWKYVTGADTLSIDRYGFEFVTTPTMSGVTESGYSYSAIESVFTRDTGYHYINCGGAAQDYSINLWYETNSEDANEWIYEEVASYVPSGIQYIPTDPSEWDDGSVPVIYNLQGIRVTHPASGIYIVGGRKVRF